MYTMQNWIQDGTFKAKIGDEVSDDIVTEMVNCVPPKSYNNSCTQIGEPYDIRFDEKSNLYKNTYTTFKYLGDGIWKFCGYCFHNETEQRGEEIIWENCM